MAKFVGGRNQWKCPKCDSEGEYFCESMILHVNCKACEFKTRATNPAQLAGFISCDLAENNNEIQPKKQFNWICPVCVIPGIVGSVESGDGGYFLCTCDACGFKESGFSFSELKGADQ